jgi:D-alanine-D-alanine ligase
VIRQEIASNLDDILNRAEAFARYPLFVKPANLGSSVGITKCLNRSDLVEGLMEASRFDRRVIIERGINAREIEVSVLGNDQPIVSIPGEIVPAREFYSYEAKYYDDNSLLYIPAPISEETTRSVQQIALKAYRAIDCSGMARVDFLLEKDEASPNGEGDLYLSEVNTIPGFTKISMYPKLWAASGLPYPELIDKLIELAVERKQVKDQIERQYTREI